MRKMKLGIIGIGYVGRIHLRNCLNLQHADLVAVSDLSKRALKTAKEMGVRETYTNYEEMLRQPEIDAVIIALPTHLHLDCSQKVAEAKKHILLEKPLARSAAEGRRLLSSIRKNGVSLMLGYPLRFTKSMRALKKKIESGVLGDVEIAYAVNIGSGPFLHRSVDNTPLPVPSWWFKREFTGGGALIDLGCHMINLLRWYFGEVTDVRSWLGHRYNLKLEDYATCIARLDSGVTGIVNVGWFSQEYQVKIELLGTVKHAIAQNLTTNPIIAAIQMLTTRSSRFWEPYSVEIASFVNFIRKDMPPSPSGEDALKDLEAIDLAYKNSIDIREAEL